MDFGYCLLGLIKLRGFRPAFGREVYELGGITRKLYTNDSVYFICKESVKEEWLRSNPSNIWVYNNSTLEIASGKSSRACGLG